MEGDGRDERPCVVETQYIPSDNFTIHMFGIRKAIGLGIAIIVLKLLMSTTFVVIEGTLQSFFSVVSHVFVVADHTLMLADAQLSQ